ncbi:MAG TPA: MFS transporter [Chitinophagaceae bacterium]|nr:MFS transporter [Chitinophagaceae bacterium]HNU14818.1 MFS transporter [Chitinophagaceae bacterium]
MSTFKIKLSLFLNYFVFAILLNSVGTVILQVQNNFGISKGSASTLEAFKDLSIAIASFLLASYVVRIGYKKAMLFALALVSVMCLIIPSVSTFLMTKLLFAAVGVSFALIKVSVFATLGLITKSKKEHISLMSFLESFFMIGVLAGYFIFSAFVNDADPKSTEWFVVYYIIAGLSILAFLLLLSTKLDESPVKKAELEETKSLADDFAGMLRLIFLPLVLVFIFCAFFYVLIEQSIMSWLPTFNNDVLKLSTSLSIQMASIMSASIALGRFLAGLLLRKIDWLFFLVACLLAAAGLVLLTVPLAKNVSGIPVNNLSDIPLVAFAFPVIGLFLAPIYPAINSVILSNLPAHKHGAMSGLIVVFSALGGTTGSIITGHVFEAYGGQTAFYFSLLPIAILIILLFIFKKLQPKSVIPEMKATGSPH